jgi:hypothetical protein
VTPSSRPSPIAGLLRRSLGVAILATVTLVVTALLPPPPAAAAPTGASVPTLAYYYIWFNPSSWNRAKTDYPLAGRYSSDERSVMRRHVELAKQAGIRGFIVSWKSTPPLDRRLAALARIAAENDFRLVLIYQGLDFYRRPLPVTQIGRDLDRFTARYSGDEAFRVLGEKPVVVISGTWKFTREEVERLTESRRKDLLILASEKSIDGYARIADLVDGDAYYWSSPDPLRTPGYQKKLEDFSAAVHGAGGVWIAPAAAGFDARLIGGGRVIDRRDGETLRRSLNAALASSPDAIGIISWNEFSENSHIEPSRKYGDRSLQVVASFLGSELRIGGEFDSSAPVGSRSPRGLITLLILAGLAVGAAPLFVRRRRRIRRQGEESDPPAAGNDRFSQSS